MGSIKQAKLFVHLICEREFGALDNIDHDPSSIYAQSSFHGTGISITQFPPTGNGLMIEVRCPFG